MAILVLSFMSSLPPPAPARARISYHTLPFRSEGIIKRGIDQVLHVTQPLTKDLIQKEKNKLTLGLTPLIFMLGYYF